MYRSMIASSIVSIPIFLFVWIVDVILVVTLALTLEPGEPEGTWAANASFVNGEGGRVSAAKLVFAPKESAI